MKPGWKVEKLGDVCDVIGGGTPSKANMKFYNGNIPWATVRDMKYDLIVETEHKITQDAVKNSSTNIIPKGNVIIATRVGLGKVCIIENDTAINQDLRGIVPKNSEKLTVRYLFLWLKSIAHLIEKEGTGATVQGVKLPFIKSIEIPIPPIPEQERIVSVLDEAFASIAQAKANAERNLVNARELFEAFAGIAFENPGDWEVKSLGDVCSLYQGIAINAKTKHALVEKSELPLLRIKDLRNNTVEQYIDPNNYPKNALVNESDLIYTRTGQIGLVFTGKRGVLHNNSFKIVPKSILSREYLFYWLQNPIFKTKIISLASRAAQPDITHELFKQQMISIPSLAEQRAIVGRLEALSAETGRLEAVYRQKVAALEELKKSALQKAFAGEL